MLDFENCPHCGQKILKGAMRCTGCGKILKTQEEQVGAIRNYTASKKRFDALKILKNILLFLIIGFLIYYFSEEILTFIKNTFSK
jgi:uncharacterized membrane protein YvbJ